MTDRSPTAGPPTETAMSITATGTYDFNTGLVTLSGSKQVAQTVTITINGVLAGSVGGNGTSWSFTKTLNPKPSMVTAVVTAPDRKGEVLVLGGDQFMLTAGSYPVAVGSDGLALTHVAHDFTDGRLRIGGRRPAGAGSPALTVAAGGPPQPVGASGGGAWLFETVFDGSPQTVEAQLGVDGAAGLGITLSRTGDVVSFELTDNPPAPVPVG